MWKAPDDGVLILFVWSGTNNIVLSNSYIQVTYHDSWKLGKGEYGVIQLFIEMNSGGRIT